MSHRPWGLLLAALAACSSSPTTPPPPEANKVGQELQAQQVPGAAPKPMSEPCETSAAVELPDGRLLVGDNETKDRVFAYTWGKAGVTPATPFELVWDKGDGRKVDDIEALALNGPMLYVVGSHSRKKTCERDKDRARILRAKVQGPALSDLRPMHLKAAKQDEDWKAATASADACLQNLFTADGRGEAARSFCESLVEAERTADPAQGKPCPQTLNVEGAAVIEGRLWLGLRAPLVGPNRYAALLRVREDGDAYLFDAVAFVGLKGQGIRELSVIALGKREALGGLAGPVEDVPDDGPPSFALWGADAAEVQPDALLYPAGGDNLLAVPNGAEGLVMRPPDALLWIDGDGKYPDACKTPHKTATTTLR